MFSEVVDSAITRTRRPSKKNDAKGYARASIRECETIDYKAFDKSLEEDQITVTASPHIYTRPANFRILRTVKYPQAGIFPHFIRPGKKQIDKTHFYYASLDNIIFKGVGVGDNIDLAYYIYQPRLTYYDIGARPAVFDGFPTTNATTFNTTGDWVYLEGGSYVSSLTGGATAEAAARALVTNWILDDWFHLIEEGIVAKLLKQASDRQAPSSFALYKSYQDDFQNGEGWESLGY